jgi:hypothetical protein
VARHEDGRIVVAGRSVVGSALEKGGEQQLGVVVNFEVEADARQQSHGLDLIAVLHEERTDHLLGGGELAVAVEVSGRGYRRGE